MEGDYVFIETRMRHNVIRPWRVARQFQTYISNGGGTYPEAIQVKTDRLFPLLLLLFFLSSSSTRIGFRRIEFAFESSSSSF